MDENDAIHITHWILLFLYWSGYVFMYGLCIHSLPIIQRGRSPGWYTYSSLLLEDSKGWYLVQNGKIQFYPPR